MTAYLCFQNNFNDADVSGTIPIEGFPVENMLDWFTYTFYKPSSKEARVNFIFEEEQEINYFAIASHNLNTLDRDPNWPNDNTFVRLLEIDNGQAELARLTPSNSAPVLAIFPTVYAKSFDVHFTRYDFSTVPMTGVLSFGKSLQLPNGIQAPFTPPPMNYDNKIFNSVSSKGQFLGRSVERFANKTKISQKNMDPQWMRDNWETVIKMLETQAFFYCWNYEEYPEDTVYCWLDGNLPVARYVDPLHASFDIKCKALYEMEWF